jgi:hypothetical protein
MPTIVWKDAENSRVLNSIRARASHTNRYVRREMGQIQSIVESELYFRNADHMDIKTIEGEVSLRQFISAMLSYYPWWILFLYRIRAFLVCILGLVKHEKPTILPSIRPEDLSFTPGENASFFIVKSAKENVYWISETPKDKHLKAYFGVVAETRSAQATKFHVFTSVYYIHWTGQIYFNIIRPFHHLVVSRMMRHGIKKKKNT